MSLSPGQTVGSYQILAELGRGGMGEVYRARDTRLNRDVAIKVLPAAVADDADRRARFEREAQAVATLSHPNIVAIFDTGRLRVDDASASAAASADKSAGQGQQEVSFVVMELLAGRTLREELAARAGAHAGIPTRKAIDIGVQIARGLGAAHGRGVIHRDLKPENVVLLDDGQVKILDFGLARRSPGSLDPGSEDPGLLATTVAATDPGIVMGTIGYMAPEQVRGQTVDARADVFAFGAVLYEMVSGQRAFKRDTAADTMTAILKEDPPELTASRPDLSPALDRIIRHCLEKNANERFQSARDVAFALEALSGSGAASGITSGAMPAAPAEKRRWLLPATVTAVVGVVALAAGVLIGRTLGRAASEITYETKTWDSQWITNARFAPDGQTIVYSAATTGNVPSLFTIRQGTVISQPVGQPGTHLLAISSTGEMAVITGATARGHRIFGGTLARMTLDGAPRAWMESVSEADWSPDGTTLAIVRRVAGKNRLEYPIGKVLYEAPNGYISDPRVSPDGRQVAFFDHAVPGDNRGFIKLVDAGGAVRTLGGEYWAEEGIAWSPDGRDVIYSASVQGGEALQPMMVNASGTPRPRQAIAIAGAMIVLDVARDGRMIVIRDELRASIRGLIPGESAEREFPWLDFAINGYLSRDMKHLLFDDESQSSGPNYAVALRTIATGQVVRLGAGSTRPLSPDGKWAPALIPSTGRLVVYPTGPGDPVSLPRDPIEHYSGTPQWFPDGRRLVVCGAEPSKPPRCYEQDITGGPPRPITPEGVSSVVMAPDGRTLLATRGREREVLTIGAAAGVPARGLTPADMPIAWTNDSRSVIAADSTTLPRRVYRVDVATGTRTFARELAPSDRAGLIGVIVNQWIDDGRGYVYSYFRELSKLFVATGVVGK